MDENTNSSEMLMRYLDNEMTAEEAKAFEEMLENDVALKNQLTDYKLAIEAIREAGTSKRVNDIHREMMAEMTLVKNPHATPVRRMVRRTMTVAAGVILVVISLGLWWWYQLSPEKVFNENIVAYQASVSRGSNEITTALESFYAQRNYRAVIGLVTKADLGPKDSLLISLSYLELDDLNTSIRWLNNLQKSNSTYRQDADYYLAFAYLKAENYDRALSLLEQVKTDKEHLYRDAVTTSLLRKIKLLSWKQ